MHSGSDRLGTIDLPWLVSGGVLGFSAVALAGYGALRLRSIGDNRSTMARKPLRFSVSFLTTRIIAAECWRAAQKRL